MLYTLWGLFLTGNTTLKVLSTSITHISEAQHEVYLLIGALTFLEVNEPISILSLGRSKP